MGSRWLPESPRYLIYYGRLDEGLEVLKNLHSNKNDASHQLATTEFEEIQRQIELDRRHELPWLSLWKKPNTRKRLIFGFLAIAIAQSSGVLVSSNDSWLNQYSLNRFLINLLLLSRLLITTKLFFTKALVSLVGKPYYYFRSILPGPAS